MQEEPLFFFGIAQKQRGVGPFESYFFLFNAGELPILNITVIKKGEFYYLMNKMEIASEFWLDNQPWWTIWAIAPNERKIKKMRELEVRHLPKKETILAEQDLPSREPIRSICWLDITYTEAGERRKEHLLYALEPDGINFLPILTSEDPHQVISRRMEECGV